ncbi:restriction endonuclease [Lysobacter humi (ex Lee et al. 2017)]
MKVYEFEELAYSPLVVDAIYRGGRRGNAADDPLGRLLQVSNSGGFRYRGRVGAKLDLVVLTTTLAEPDWPDSIDRETGIFTYYGDNRKPGRELHDTPRKGNQLLRDVFSDAHAGQVTRRRVPPIFLFASTAEWRDVQFLGLAVPGANDLMRSEDLSAIWRVAGSRFQNYRAKFTVLDCSSISRDWLETLIAGVPADDKAPPAWLHWVATGRAKPLAGPRSIDHRSKAEQLPETQDARALLSIVHQHFAGRPHDFEHFAAAIAQMMLPDISAIDVTRPSRDGGRDAVGKMRIGAGPSAITVDFALEAKCYGPTNSVGVRDMSRLISRLRHRQFGVLVTTSWVDTQAYKEIKEDQHPVIVISGGDIVRLLQQRSIARAGELQDWLQAEFGSTKLEE